MMTTPGGATGSRVLAKSLLVPESAKFAALETHDFDLSVDPEHRIFFSVLRSAAEGRGGEKLIPKLLQRYADGGARHDAEFLLHAQEHRPPVSSVVSQASLARMASVEISPKKSNNGGGGGGETLQPSESSLMPHSTIAAIEAAVEAAEQQHQQRREQLAAALAAPASPQEALRDVRDVCGITPLMLLVQLDDLSHAERAIELGCGVHARDDVPSVGWTPLFYAVAANKLAAVKLLVEKYGVDAAAERDATGWTPLHVAADKGHAEVAQYLLSTTPRGDGAALAAFVNALDVNKAPAIFYAARKARVSVVKVLLSAGNKTQLDFVTAPSRSVTVLHAAVESRIIFRRRFVSASSSPSPAASPSSPDALPTLHAGVDSTAEVLSLLCDAIKKGMTPTALAKLLQQQANRDEDCNTALHVAAAVNDPVACRLIAGLAGSKKAAAGLLAIQNSNGRTALELAIEHGHDDCARELMRARGDCCACCVCCA